MAEKKITISIRSNSGLGLIAKEKAIKDLSGASDEELKKLHDLFKSPNGRAMLADNWDVIKSLVGI